MRQFFRWAAVALNKRGYQASGTVMVRPSRRATLRVSLVNFTSATRSSAASAKMPMPSLQECRFMFGDQFLNPPQLLGREPEVPREPDRLQVEPQPVNRARLDPPQRRNCDLDDHRVYSLSLGSVGAVGCGFCLTMSGSHKTRAISDQRSKRWNGSPSSLKTCARSPRAKRSSEETSRAASASGNPSPANATRRPLEMPSRTTAALSTPRLGEK